MEENRRFSWSDLFIKVIIVIIFVLFTIWLLSLSNKGLSNSLDVLTNNIFSQNMEKMKEVGKEYFTVDRLPKKVGEVETLTLKEMYEKKLILELTDKNGNACDAEDSYVSIEKLENEYQMKVNLECGEEEEYIIVIMGCYDYCDTDICELDTTKEETSTKETEYEYKKTTGGSWTDYGKWSEWSKVAVTNTDYRQIETKIEKEDYSYDKTITEVVYEEFEASCPSGYKMTSDGTKCYKTVTSTKTKNPVCKTLSGYTLVSQDGFNCTYSKKVTSTITDDAVCIDGYSLVNGVCSKTTTTTKTGTATCPTGYTKSGNTCVKTTTETANPTCPTKSGYTLTGRNGFTCNYVKTTTETKNPTCPTLSGYTLTGRNGFTCNYVKTTTETKNPTCPTKSEYIVTRDGFTCTYKKYIKGDYVTTETGEYVPANTDKYIYEEVGSAEYVYDCENSCAFRWIHTYKIYKTKLETKTEPATCPTGYTKSGSTCAKSTTDTKTETATCPTGYTKSGSTCSKSTTDTKTATASCPTEYTKSGTTCVKATTSTKNPTCPTVSGYTLTGRNGFTCNYAKTTTETRDPVCMQKDGYTFIGRNGLTCNYSKTTTSTKTETATCETGYTKSRNTCVKTTTNTTYKDLIKNCPVDYKETDDGSNCYKEVISTVTVTGTRDVTYYRYRVREYIGGTTDYKWSKSKEDKDLLNAGYKLTGRTR